MRRNKLRELLKAGNPSVGTHLQISWPSIVELVGHTGVFDYVEFVAEYAPYDLYTLENMGRAIDLFDMTGMIKVEQQPRTYLAVRAIGSGIQNVLFADPRTVEDVQDIIARLRDRGIGLLVTDHRARETLAITDRAYLISDGELRTSGTSQALADDPEVRRIYLGEGFRM